MVSSVLNGSQAAPFVCGMNYFRAKLLGNEPRSATATYQVCSLKLRRASLEFYSVLRDCEPPQVESPSTQGYCVMERENHKRLGRGAAFSLVNPLASLGTPVNLGGLIGPYGSCRGIWLGGGDGAKVGPYGEGSQPGRPHAGSCSTGPVPRHVLDSQLSRGEKFFKKVATEEKNIIDLKILS